ncbi:MAG: YndJ family protein [Bythopirellula sp.]
MSKQSAVIGMLVWLIGVGYLRPHPFDTSWAHAILGFAPLVIVPLAAHVVMLSDDVSLWWQRARLAQLPAAILFAVALILPQGWQSALLSLPWFLVALMFAGVGLANLTRHGIRSPERLGVSAGMIMLLVGASWAMLDRWGMRPLKFEPVIVLLTAIHFHYAGFALPILAGLVAPWGSQAWGMRIVAAVILSVPAVAIGITATQLQLQPIFETMAAWLMSLAGTLVSWSYWRQASQTRWPASSRRLWRFASAALAAGMVLSLLYGSRQLTDVSWLDIPWMRALHGTANAFGFTLVALWGWAVVRRQPGFS